MKNITLAFILGFSLNTIAQVFNFNDSLHKEGWTYYDNFNSLPTEAFIFDSTSSRLYYSNVKSTQTSVLYTQLEDSIGGYGNVFTNSYSASFKINPSTNNFNGYLPLILSENLMTGTNRHPWRDNPTNPSIAGPVNNNHMLAVLISSTAVKILAKKDANTIFNSGFKTPFHIGANKDYWIELKSINTNIIKMSVFNDSLFYDTLATEDFLIPSLAAFKYLYIANSNGNTSTNQSGYVDNYRVSQEKPTVIQNIESQSSVTVFPNPVKNILYIAAIKNPQYRILSIDGNVLLSGQSRSIDIAELKAGSYIISILNEGHIVSELFIKE